MYITHTHTLCVADWVMNGSQKYQNDFRQFITCVLLGFVSWSAGPTAELWRKCWDWTLRLAALKLFSIVFIYIYISFYICIHAWMLCSGGIHNLEQNEANYILGVWYYIVSAVRSEWDLVYSCTPNGELISKQVFDKWIHNSFKLMHLLLSASLHSIRSFIRWLGSDLMYLVTDCLTGSLTHRPRI